ncbi:MAG: SAM-dependent methyltransferase [Anaerolinea sp.]|nr:SAM-dependent methyltransferase [Anaerolinea sp.]
MVSADHYALLDCGDGRRLEAFGPLLLDRPAPGAAEPRCAPDRWAGAAVYRPGSGWWHADGTPMTDEAHPVRIAGLTVEVRPTASGGVGLFPEHASNAAWLSAAMGRRSPRSDPTAEAASVLNLFAYTGLASLIAVGTGARVVHVDASRPAVQWARRNAELSSLMDRPIRWIVDDALAFVRREARRGRRYAGLILDPPSYGHGGRGGRTAWRFDDRIDELLDACADIAEPDAFWLLTAHTPGWDPARLAATLRAATIQMAGGAPAHTVEGVPLQLVAESGAVLRLGAAARFDPLRANRR